MNLVNFVLFVGLHSHHMIFWAKPKTEMSLLKIYSILAHHHLYGIPLINVFFSKAKEKVELATRIFISLFVD